MADSAAKRKGDRLSRRERIVLRSISLFNRYGVQRVSIERICSDLRISPGNLTYYFARRDDLLQATVSVVKDRLRQSLERPASVKTPGAGASYLIRVFRTFWNVRFYFDSIPLRSTESPEPSKEYNAFREGLLRIMEADIEYLARRGYLRSPVAPNSFGLLSDNIYALLLTWLRTHQIEDPAARTPSKRALRDVALHLWSLCQHWMAPPFAASLLAAFEELLGPAAPRCERATRGGRPIALHDVHRNAGQRGLA